MNYKAVAEELKRIAEAEPWEPLVPPPRKHFRSLDNGLTICFTLDILPRALKFWHLSLSRIPGGLSQAEQQFWCGLFFDEPPTIGPLEIPGLLIRHFYWPVK